MLIYHNMENTVVPLSYRHSERYVEVHLEPREYFILATKLHVVPELELMSVAVRNSVIHMTLNILI